MGNDIGAPEVPYMSYCPKRREKEEDYGPTPEEIEEKKRKSKARNLSDESFELYGEGRYEEALIFANRFLEYDSNSSAAWNRKGIILDGLNRFEESVECYDAAIDLKDNEIYENNKAETCIAYASSLKDSGKYTQALDIITNFIYFGETGQDSGSI